MVACFLARKGYQVDVYEMRADPRDCREEYTGKSINLAMSERGRSALRRLGIEEEVLEEHAIPMRARLIHDTDGRTRVIPYGTRAEECIYSVSRRFLNQRLLQVAQANASVNIYFHHKMQSVDFASGKIEFAVTSADAASSGEEASTRAAVAPERRPGGESRARKVVEARVVIGADGAFSCVRKHLMKQVRMDFSQTFIDHGYMELCIPATPDGGFAMPANYLHIWPRDEFMMIALPNQDHSFTVTLFMPFAAFHAITSHQQLLSFFRRHFPDSLDLIGESRLLHDFFSCEPASLVSIKCSPIHWKDRVLLIGDAAHAMVPFYGQGMNCGFEDCVVLDDLLTGGEAEEEGEGLAQAFADFQRIRSQDHHVICDLAMYNYTEMRHLVNSASFLLRKRIDLLLNRLFPRSWIPLYQMVTFTRIPYHECLERKRQQDSLLTGAAFVTSGLLTIAASFLLLHSFPHWVSS